MSRAKSNGKKKLISLGVILSVGLVVGSTLAFTAYTRVDGQQQEIVVLDNQHKEIQNSLSINNIANVKGFTGSKWINETQIIGQTVNDDICQIEIYDISSGDLKQVTSNTRTYEEVDIQLIDHATKEGSNFILYEQNEVGSISSVVTPFDLYMLDVSTLKSLCIDKGVGAVASMVDSKIIYSKGLKIYEFDANTGISKEIQLPGDLVRELSSFSETFEDFMDVYGVPEGQRNDEYIQTKLREQYQYQKGHLGYLSLSKENDKLVFRTYIQKIVHYNMINKTFEVEPTVNNDTTQYPLSIVDGQIEEIIYEDGTEETWILDDKGERKELLEGVKLSYLSPDKSKLAYVLDQDSKSIYIYDFKNYKSVPIFNNPRSEIFWSKDGKSIFFITVEGRLRIPSNIVTNIIKLEE